MRQIYREREWVRDREVSPTYTHIHTATHTCTHTVAGTPGLDEGQMFWPVKPAVKWKTKRIEG